MSVQTRSNTPLTLLHTEWSSGWGGQEIRILAESKAFRDRGYKVLLATQPDGLLFQRASEAGFEVFRVPMHKGLNFGAVAALRRIIERNAVDIVHTHSSVDHRLAGMAARLAGRPVVRSRHLSTPIKRSPFSHFLYTKLADRVITSGEFIRKAMVEFNKMPAEQIVSIPAGIDVAQFSLQRALPDVRADFAIPPDAFVVGIVGVLRSWKGHGDLIRAFVKLRESVPDARLMIVGEGVQRPAIEAQIRETGLMDAIFLTGHQKDPAPFIKAMDVVCLPSYANEATSQVLPQAMAMRRAVVSTDIGGLPEVVIDGVTGLVVPPRDADALCDRLLTLQRDPALRQRLADAGYDHTQKHFTFEGMIDRTEAVYRSLPGLRSP